MIGLIIAVGIIAAFIVAGAVAIVGFLFAADAERVDPSTVDLEDA